MKKLWYEVKYFWHTHDSIEMFLFACIFGFLGWMVYHTVIGIVDRFFA